jgi:thiamine-monophosphate kinase
MKQESQLVQIILRALPSTAGSRVGLPRVSPQSTKTKLEDRHRSATRRKSSVARLGPGDDAAILSPSGETDWVLSCDAFIEGVHFLAKTHPPDSIGYKSLARATSDLAAMGATPRYFLLTLGLPKSRTSKWLGSFLKGMARASRELGILIIGGDTTSSSAIAISITVLGEVTPGQAVQRAGAKMGDLIYVSGKLGRAQLGLELVLAGFAREPKFRSEVQPHLYPKVKTDLGTWLAKNDVATAMMDISDGLSTDLARLCAASGVGAKIYANKIPGLTIPPAVFKKLRNRKLDPLQMALHGGEDYELLFTVSPSQARRLRRAPNSSALTMIGEITKNENQTLIDGAGKKSPLRPLGWDPF